MSLNLSILASGSGTNAENIIKYLAKKTHLNLGCVITDNENALVINRCRKLGVECHIIKFRGDKTLHEKEVLATLKEYGTDWVLLAGYMRVLSPVILKEFFNSKLNRTQIVNIHPSLLPRHKGLLAYEKAFAANDRKGGVSLHYVDAGIDTGEIIIQKSFRRDRDDSLDSFKKKGMELEYKCYQEFLDSIELRKD